MMDVVIAISDATSVGNTKASMLITYWECLYVAVLDPYNQKALWFLYNAMVGSSYPSRWEALKKFQHWCIKTKNTPICHKYCDYKINARYRQINFTKIRFYNSSLSKKTHQGLQWFWREYLFPCKTTSSWHNFHPWACHDVFLLKSLSDTQSIMTKMMKILSLIRFINYCTLQ